MRQGSRAVGIGNAQGPDRMVLNPRRFKPDGLNGIKFGRHLVQTVEHSAGFGAGRGIGTELLRQLSVCLNAIPQSGEQASTLGCVCSAGHDYPRG